ncbi:uncharacterized protein K460DRAFT_49535 [Cucurbitaria berberidis CBS 394.84]|uniref:Uncharacterized protein n=1 Tax=Cucurbitaria berberidis CBS 394.84 TaxID=1168544 RepID=A0A9P4GKF2_9PLEO|nr:uncharacterized protein K460DRAFT_49535 [Cucurbitaria berberidis CBS 394.84]KAF1846882.1 hypothetical protein K460DRAFT_49535 [Cucurbitaria berberidis CBS 394.84]
MYKMSLPSPLRFPVSSTSYPLSLVPFPLVFDAYAQPARCSPWCDSYNIQYIIFQSPSMRFLSPSLMSGFEPIYSASSVSSLISYFRHLRCSLCDRLHQPWPTFTFTNVEFCSY